MGNKPSSSAGGAGAAAAGARRAPGGAPAPGAAASSSSSSAGAAAASASAGGTGGGSASAVAGGGSGSGASASSPPASSAGGSAGAPPGSSSGVAGAGAASASASAGSSSASSSAAVPHAVKRAALEDFVLLKTVGKGSFGKVVMVRKKDDGRVYAMKVLKKEMVLRRRQYEHTLAERRILQATSHPFIVSLHFAFQTEHKLYMVFDFFNGGELYHYLSEGGRFEEARARFYAAEIACALGYMHERGIVYRDLKPENLILDRDGHIRITDFGLSKEGVVGDTITSICGTPEYLAPEILRKRPYGVAVDWWSLGTLLWEMIAGLPPFYDRNRQVMYKKILEAPLEPPAFMSPEAADLCAKMLVREPTARLGYGGAAGIKAHAFFKGLDWDALERRQVPPPWTPRVADETDTRNIAAEFTSELAAVTPSPAGVRLRDLVGDGAGGAGGGGGGGGSPPAFDNFSFVQTSVMPDGTTYRVSVGGDEEEELVRDGLSREEGAGGFRAGAGAGAGAGGGGGGAGAAGGGGAGGGGGRASSGAGGGAGSEEAASRDGTAPLLDRSGDADGDASGVLGNLLL